MQNKPNIVVTSLLKVESSEFIDRIIQTLQQYGISPGQHERPRQSIGEKGDEKRHVDSDSDEIQEDEGKDALEKHLLEKAKRIMTTLEKRFGKVAHEDCLPEPCQGMGLWRKLLLPGCNLEIKEGVCKAIFYSREVEYNVHDSMN